MVEYFFQSLQKEDFFQERVAFQLGYFFFFSYWNFFLGCSLLVRKKWMEISSLVDRELRIIKNMAEEHKKVRKG